MKNTIKESVSAAVEFSEQQIEEGIVYLSDDPLFSADGERISYVIIKQFNPDNSSRTSILDGFGCDDYRAARYIERAYVTESGRRLVNGEDMVFSKDSAETHVSSYRLERNRPARFGWHLSTYDGSLQFTNAILESGWLPGILAGKLDICTAEDLEAVRLGDAAKKREENTTKKEAQERASFARSPFADLAEMLSK